MYLPILAAFAPFILWLIEVFLPYPAIVEEVGKALILYPNVKDKPVSQRIKLGIIFGSIFAFSESVFYFLRIYSYQDGLIIFLTRLLFTVALHALTATIIAANSVNKKWIRLLISLLSAITLHYLYNKVIA